MPIELILGIEDMRRIGLIVVIVVVQVLPAVPKRVTESRRGDILDIRINCSDGLVYLSGGPLIAAVNVVWSTLPNQGILRFSALPVGVQTVCQSGDPRFSTPNIGVDTCPVFSAVAVDFPRTIRRRCSVCLVLHHRR